MQHKLPETMRSAALNQFGGPDTLKMQTVSVPALDRNDVLVRIHTADVGEWDAAEREGYYAEMFGEPIFPYILGSGGAGTVAAVGQEVTDLKVGDQVYVGRFPNPKGGFYAEFAVVDAGYVLPVPENLTIEQAAVMGGVGITALRGLEDTLKLKSGESILIFGAGGGIGHVAVQLAKKMGAHVLAIASGEDGVALAQRLGADAAVDGRGNEAAVLETVREFAPDGLDVVLLTAGADVVQKLLSMVRQGGRVAYPNGIDPVPQEIMGIQITSYNGETDPDILQRFHQLASEKPFDVHIAQTFPLDQAAEAHRALEEHYLGKLALHVPGNP
jgi:NADPH:quinone reductase